MTPGAPAISAIVEELFPAEAISDLHAFFGAADDDDLRDRMERMLASTAAFGANENVDTVPTSRYRVPQPVRRRTTEGEPMTTLDEAVALARDESGLTVVSTLRADNTIQASLVNAGVLPHPENGSPVMAFVTYGRVKLANLRARPQLAATFRNGWQWATVEGNAELAGPDDPQPWLADADQLRLLLREVFTAAGGTHDDWDAYDATMAEQRRTAVLVAPTRVYSNG